MGKISRVDQRPSVILIHKPFLPFNCHACFPVSLFPHNPPNRPNNPMASGLLVAYSTVPFTSLTSSLVYSSSSSTVGFGDRSNINISIILILVRLRVRLVNLVWGSVGFR